MPGGICPRCGRPVYQAEEKSAFGRSWHSFCFSCNLCRKLLDIPDAVAYDNEIYCQQCTIGANYGIQPNANISRKEFDVENQCQANACKVTFAECPRASTSTRSMYSDGPRPTKSLRATPSPTGITTYYNRQHPSSHSDVGGRRRIENNGRPYDRERQKSYEYLATVCKSNTLHLPYEDDHVKIQDGHFTVNIHRVPSYSNHNNFREETVIKVKEEKGLPAAPNFSHGSSSREGGVMQSGPLEQYKDPDKIGFKRSDFESAGQHTSECPCTREDRSSSSGSRSGYNCGSGYCPGKYNGRKIWYGGGFECRRCGRNVYHAEMLLASGAAFHNICFSCYACRKPLDAMTVFENRGEIYCKQCYIKLFGPTGYGYGLGAGVLQMPF